MVSIDREVTNIHPNPRYRRIIWEIPPEWYGSVACRSVEKFNTVVLHNILVVDLCRPYQAWNSTLVPLWSTSCGIRIPIFARIPPCTLRRFVCVTHTYYIPKQQVGWEVFVASKCAHKHGVLNQQRSQRIRVLTPCASLKPRSTMSLNVF